MQMTNFCSSSLRFYRVADMIKGKTPEQIRAEFEIENDFTPEQLEEVRRDNAWCSEDRWLWNLLNPFAASLFRPLYSFLFDYFWPSRRTLSHCTRSCPSS